ncbi:reverse transcriptase domain-containing protein, partial [Thiolapillus sp.]|uniref:reverse transcriptase domain-containing protein n=1 Tax=Thiolapillus sp. TaxID=2017437 RepID=UPI003AF4764A
DYLTNRLQYVRLNGVLSSVICTNTGAPQGTVLAPFLFSLYTADCRSTDESCPLVKFADDTELVGKISNDEDALYHKQIENFVNWCDKNYLYLNVSKTKEMCIDFRKNQRCPKPVYIKGEAVERVETYKYLGVVFDSKLNWKENINSVLKKVNTRMYCLRKLRSFGVNSGMLVTFYNAVICSIIVYGSVCWGGNISKFDRGRLEKIVKKAGHVVGMPLDSFKTLYEKRLLKKLMQILNDPTHPMRHYFDSRRSNRSGRFLLPKTNTNRYKASFLPSALSVFNENYNSH